MQRDARVRAAFVVTLLMFLGLIGVFVATNFASQATKPQLPLVPPETTPLLGGRQGSLEEAEASLKIPLPLPSTDLANDDRIEEVWIREGFPQALLVEYSSGMRVVIREDDRSLSDVAYYELQIRDGIPGEIVKHEGVHMFVVPQSGEGDLGSVTLERAGVIATAIGHGDFETDDFVVIGRSMVDATTTNASR